MKKRMVLGIYGNIIIKNAVPWYFTSILCNKPIIVPWSFTFHELQNGGVVLCKGGTLVREIRLVNNAILIIKSLFAIYFTDCYF